MSPRPDVSAQRVPQILKAAAEVIGARGLGVATVAEIAAQAGLSKALVFKYFHNKDELVAALVGSLFEGIAGPERRTGATCAQAIQAWAAGVAEAVESSAFFPAIAAELLATASRDAGLSGVVQGAYRRLQADLARLVAIGVEEGEFRAVDADVAATTIVAQIEGANVLHLVAGERLQLRLAYAAGIGLLLDGLAATRPPAPKRA
jgi:AcrR family transcriptional regulator